MPRRQKAETSEVQAERIRRQKVSGDRRVALQGYSGQGSPCTRENDEDQGQRACRLPGNGDAAVFADGDSMRGGILV